MEPMKPRRSDAEAPLPGEPAKEASQNVLQGVLPSSVRPAGESVAREFSTTSVGAQGSVDASSKPTAASPIAGASSGTSASAGAPQAPSGVIEVPASVQSESATGDIAGSAVQLIGEAMRDARRLVEVEVALARDEIRREVREAKIAGASFGLAAVISIIALTMFVVAIALAFSSAGLASLILGGILMGIAGVAALVGAAVAPRTPLGRTRNRLRADIRAVKSARERSS